MSEFNYLVSVALIEQNNQRMMPISGKSIKEPLNASNIQTNNVHKIALELLLRVLERSKDGAIKRSYGEKSLLLLQIPMEKMQKELKLYKQIWIEGGNSELFLTNITSICNGIWSLNFVKYEGLQFNKLK